MDPLVILIAFIAGLGFRRVGFPPLLGYLLAGFIAHAFGYGSIESIAPIADLGILLLLFTIGLKLNIKELAAPQIWAVAGAHMLIVVVLTVPVILLVSFILPKLALENSSSAWALAFALSFSSTVFAVKIFDERGEQAALHAKISIGILIIQDLFAVAYLVLSSDKPIGFEALILLLLPLLRPLFLYLLRITGHGELLVLLGVVVAIGGAELFELFNLKGGLGALIFGVLLGGTEKSNELYKSLISLKDLFLIGFFIQIGYYGLPSSEMIIAAAVLGALVFLRPIIYYFLLVFLKLRARTAFLTGMSLFNYSEFGLIVAAIAASQGYLADEWVTTLSLAMVISFFIAIPFNTRVHSIFGSNLNWLNRFERAERLPEEELPDLGDSEVAILGMGRVGHGVYQFLEEKCRDKVIGVEESVEKTKYLNEKGVNCVHGDATDYEFWVQTNLADHKIIFVSLSNHSENINLVNVAKQLNFKNTLAVVSRFPDEQQELEEMGCVTFNLYAEAGHGFAEHVLEQIGNLEAK